MFSTKRLYLPFFLVIVCAAGTACTADTPTGGIATPAEARRSGIGFGSGNVVPDDSTDAQGTSAAQNNAAVESDSTATARGIGFGSGN